MKTLRLALILFAFAAACGTEDESSVVDDVPADNLTDGKGDGPGAPPVVPIEPAVRYPTDQTYSPITPSIARNLQRIAANRSDVEDDVFAKVGDSITVATTFLNCFAGSNVDLDGRTELQDTLDHFRAGRFSPWKRASVAAKGGWMAHQIISGTPSRLATEIETLHPRYAVIMFGTNDAASRALHHFGPSMLDIVDRLIRRGVVPILSTVPPNRQNAATNAEIPFYNAVIRGIAQGRQVPLMDFNRELAPLPRNGLSGDGVHPSAYGGGACKLTADGLKYGYNVRNLLTLRSLDRARSIVEGGAAPDVDPGPAVSGAGVAGDPFVIDRFPFSDLRDTSRSPSREIDLYDGCDAPQDESGPEYIYRIELDHPVKLRAAIFDRGDVDVDLHLLGDTTGESCIERHDRELTATLGEGVHYLVVDSFVGADHRARAGEFLLVVTAAP